MEYIEIFNQIDREISNKIEYLQKQQDKLLERKKYLLDTKQKIHCFLSDAYEMRQLLNFSPDLAESVNAELNKIFQGEENLRIESKNQLNDSKIESTLDFMDNQDLDSQMVIDAEQEEPIKIYKFVDSDGKDTSF